MVERDWTFVFWGWGGGVIICTVACSSAGLLLPHRAEVTKCHCQALQICTWVLLANIVRWVWCVR